jgi:hypothetical protein
LPAGTRSGISFDLSGGERYQLQIHLTGCRRISISPHIRFPVSLVPVLGSSTIFFHRSSDL